MTARKLPIREKTIENSILSWLKLRGFNVWKNPTVGIYDKQLGTYRRDNSIHRAIGAPDIIGVLPDGIFLGIEVKSETGRLSEHQKKFLGDIRFSNGIAFVARSIEDVELELKQLGYI